MKVVEIPKVDLDAIVQHVQEVLACGFGVVEIHIRNGHIYRVTYAKEDYREIKKS